MKFKDYIRGNRHGKNANKLEREALNDLFLQDAIDGFDMMEGDFGKDMEELEKRIRRKTNSESERKFNYKRFFGIAAIAILLILGLGGLYYFGFFEKDDTPSIIAKKDTLTQHDDMAVLNEKNAIAIPESVVEIEETPPVETENVFVYADTTSATQEALTDSDDDAYQPDTLLKDELPKNTIAEEPMQQQTSVQKESYPKTTERQTVALGTQEFLRYFEENRKQNICDGAKAEVIVNFTIDAQGKPAGIFIKKSDCDALRQEVIRLLGKSPKWPQQKGTVEMNIRVN